MTFDRSDALYGTSPVATSDRVGAERVGRAGLKRREFLGVVLAAGAGATVLRLPHRGIASTGLAGVASTGAFLTDAELAILDAATARIVPTDSQIGARDANVVNYIQQLLSTALGGDANCDTHLGAADLTGVAQQLGPGGEATCSGADVNGDGVVDGQDARQAEAALFAPLVARDARIDAGGPFSGRQPQPHFDTGTTPCQTCHVAPPQIGSSGTTGRAAAELVDNYPPNFFQETLPLPRVRRLSWTIRLLGADAVPEAAANPLATELLETDMRRKYRRGLAALDAKSREMFGGKSFVELTPQQQTSVFDKSDPDFVTLLTYHTIEGLLCPPEYGGNRDRVGWQLIKFDGDSQPLGYTIYNAGTYQERQEKPNSGPNPDEDCSGFSEKVKSFLTVVSNSAPVRPGGPFPNPYCFEVPS